MKKISPLLRRYALALVFSLGAFGLYHFVEIRAFDLDINRMTREHLFHLRHSPAINENVIIMNIGQIRLISMESIIDSLLMCEPKAIGINLCHFNQSITTLVDQYRNNSKVVFVNCEEQSLPGTLSRVIDDGNIVTHFNSNRDDYFEFKLVDFNNRQNVTEMINFNERRDHYKAELSDLWRWSGMLKDKIVLVGYMGNYITDSIYDYQSTRITPMNIDYGQEGILPDMYDTEISASIIRTIQDHDFIVEVSSILRIAFLLLFSIVGVSLHTLVKTRWLFVNLLVALFLFFLLTMGSGLLIVYLFASGYYLSLDELPLMLLIVIIFTVALNIAERVNVAPTPDVNL